MITLHDVNLQRGSKILLQEAQLRLHDGHKVGLVGANGTGKSTLFKMLSGELAADQGECNIPSGWRIAHMAQEVSHSDLSALDYVLDGDARFRQLQAEIEQGGQNGQCGEQLGRLYAEFESIDGYTAETRAQSLMNGLGFAATDGERPVRDFSGGWRIRLNLAQALMCPADLLLLDEPTNHLDLDTTWWLEQRLQQFKGTLLIISHDRDFLDSTVNHIVHIEHQKLNLYSGSYSSFERQRAERLAQQQQMFERQQTQIAEIERFVARFRAKATKARQAQSRLKALERLERIAPAHVDSPFQFQIPCADKTSQPLLQLVDASIGYDASPILSSVNLRIEPDSRLGLLGPNGAGKSTLIKALVGELPLIGGQRTAGENLAVGYFNQHQLESLDLHASAALHIQRLSPSVREQEVRNFLGGFGFHGDRAFEVIQHFSGGEKARLALALIAWQKPNLLLLDEPTNHLDLDMREALTLALQTYPGAVLVISHDRHLLRNTVDEFWLIADGRADQFDGDLDDYHRWLDNREDTPPASEEKSEPRQDRREQRQQAAAQRKQLQPLRKKLQAAERQVDKWQTQCDEIEQQLADTSLYDADRKDDLQGLLKRQGELRQRLDTAEEEWMLLSEEYEMLEQQVREG
ncbi:ATP-binding cassette domain-containing protein [Pseudomaricurvus alkylphenolicus]|uniref:ABC-F family ATP-binding cassette domain-containing protein n=1 Tax=Pseudomaricurvus alkylphenolicus TaxID=1306991 RepID=UPI0014226118|nr:ATP-binding cassette domain-containing protein [Pseudomaricurvus alkylphenolicus]NIB39566.1 ATP-binding cassette domain-containing protein [Pseudomaricurvus alkylphenolicus]